MRTTHFHGRVLELFVSSQRVELLFNDGTRAALHNVMSNHDAQRYLRAVPHAAGEYIVDVRKLAPELGEDLCTTAPLDVPYLLCTTFRLRFKSASAFVDAARAHAIQLEVCA